MYVTYNYIISILMFDRIKRADHTKGESVKAHNENCLLIKCFIPNLSNSYNYIATLIVIDV